MSRHGLHRVLGLGFGLAVIVGGTIGVGILRTPGLVAASLPSRPAILAVWAVGGLYTLIGAVCFAELGTAVPREGGYYVYAGRAFGDGMGFAVGWTDWLTYCAVLGYLSIAMAEFGALLAPALAPWTRPVACLLLLLLVGLQWLGVRAGDWFQQATTVVKFAAFLALVGAAFFLHPTLRVTAPALPVHPTTLAGIVAALQAVVITYAGWQAALYFVEEDHDPTRNLPRSMIGGVLAVIVVYLLVNAALLNVLPIPVLARSTLPAAVAANLFVGSRGGALITALSLVSLVPVLNAVMMIGTRILFGMSRDGMIWSRASSVNAGGTPGAAMAATTAVALVLIATGTFAKLVAITAFFLTLNFCICAMALVVLRRKEPELARPFRAWGYPWSAAVVVAGALAFLLGSLSGDPLDSLLALALGAAGLVWYLAVRRRSIPEPALRVRSSDEDHR